MDRKILLFSLRLGVYLGTMGLIYLHPGIAVRFDPQNLLLWFALAPAEHLAGFLPAPGGRLRYTFGLAVLLMVFFLAFAGFSAENVIAFFGVGTLVFAGTLLLFHYPKWAKFTALEPFFLSYICLKLLNFSRSGEETSGQSLGITQVIMIWTILSFLINSVIVYLCLNPPSLRGIKRESALFACGSAGALLLVFFLPPDFVRNSVVENLISEQKPEIIKDSDEWGIPKEGGREGRKTIPQDGNGENRQPGLRGLSEYEWPNMNGGQGEADQDGKNGKKGRRRGRGSGSGEDQQYAVMIVASEKKPVYMGDSFNGDLDPVRGFLPSPDEPLNALPKLRLFTMWSEPSVPKSGRNTDRGRERTEVFSLSSLSQNYLPYRPVEVDPTILAENSGPFHYIHRVRSDMHAEDPLALIGANIRPLRSAEKEALAGYLEVPLRDEDRAVFDNHLQNALHEWNNFKIETGNDYMKKIAAILLSFNSYQYYIGKEEDTSIAALADFLLRKKEDGDCTEFSNTAAILGRLAGVPSRVVTGYLASDDLQTPAHLKGLAVLRSKIKVLQEFPFDDLLLVTDAHAHSWTQFYVPDYGWLDFEATQFAIPPMGFGDANQRDVVIPLIDENRVLAPVRAFPWRTALRAMAVLAGAGLLGAYGLRYGREILLGFGARRGGRAGARSLYLLLLARLAAEGKPIKPASKTAAEYAAHIPGEAFASFAAIYGELRWREFFKNPEEQELAFKRLKETYEEVVKTAKRRGIKGFFARAFSLRGLSYM
ncbi:MAG: transglutaminase-like domain-containing protein [Spirochaetaceae bacterium]|jgi:hypothetical protein|nr:transglutaminase-like domain-containing protein [Spirochaetaceae bacterium]